MVIDAHNHLWQFSAVKHVWINEDMAVLQRHYMPSDLQPLLNELSIDGSVAVQADESEEENIFLLRLADENDFIKGVVGWIDMLSDDLNETLAYYSGFKKIKGFRYVLQDKADRALMLHPVFKKNIALFKQYRFTYDILILYDQLGYVDTLVKSFPQQKFVIDHLAKPAIKLKELNEWREAIAAVAKNENVYCKLSGIVTEADWTTYTYNDFVPYMQTVLEAFGSSRLIYGSDWPVCLLAAPYHKVFDIAKRFISTLSNNEQENIMGNNAIAFYNL